MIEKEGKRSKLKIFPQNFRGQVTVFIILAVLIIALGVLIYMFWPKIVSNISPETKNPSAYIQECMEEEIQDTVETISLQGGDYVVDKNTGYFYKDMDEEEGTYVRYLCYTNENFVRCVNQEAFLTKHIESEILNAINPSIINCFNSMKKSYTAKGYEVNLERGTPKVNIIPNEIYNDFNSTLTLKKGEESEVYSTFELKLESNLHDILEVTKNIIMWEIYTGDALLEAYSLDNPYLKIERHRKENDVKIYVLTDRNTEEVFRFAVRSFANPVGFGEITL